MYTQGAWATGRLLKLAALLVMTGTAACESLTLRREPEIARIRIDSPDVDEITLVTSQWFLRVPDPECPDACVRLIELVEADTVTIALPYDQQYPFDFRLQLFAEAYTVTPVAANVSMLVHVDDREWMNDARTLQPDDGNGEQETLRFVYEYNTLGIN
ncbi:MAG: hypothetical protein HKN73_07575 [Gemmatimonadetes bacterium]|nr:hypothetical protein [Gemmatimonadota bacterium]